ncbi:MAG: hypothetical protein D6704_03925 [Nitrospirae bacterium]|nr:MAG: hypothetical protein D6704_03925 [Nitrospirota bacterium]
MNVITPDFSLFTRFANLFSSSDGRSTQHLSTVDAQSQTHTGLSIVTAQGDRVTLSTNTSFAGTAVRYNARGVVEGQPVSLRSQVLEGELTQEKRLTIEGDLNDEEIRDIQHIIRQVNGLKRDVTAGNIPSALTNAQRVQASGSLASVEVHIQHTESLAVSRTNLLQPAESPRIALPAVNHESAPPLSPSTFLSFLRNLFESRPIQQPTQTEEEDHTSPALNSSVESSEKKPNPTIEPHRDAEAISGVGSFLENIGKRILKGAKTLAKLAETFQETVERQADKLARAFARLTEARREGDMEKAERVQRTINQHAAKLDKTAERFADRIETATERLTQLTDRLTDRLRDSGESASPAAHIESVSTDPSSETDEPKPATLSATET